MLALVVEVPSPTASLIVLSPAAEEEKVVGEIVVLTNVAVPVPAVWLQVRDEGTPVSSLEAKE